MLGRLSALALTGLLSSFLILQLRLLCRLCHGVLWRREVQSPRPAGLIGAEASRLRTADRPSSPRSPAADLYRPATCARVIHDMTITKEAPNFRFEQLESSFSSCLRGCIWRDEPATPS